MDSGCIMSLLFLLVGCVFDALQFRMLLTACSGAPHQSNAFMLVAGVIADAAAEDDGDGQDCFERQPPSASSMPPPTQVAMVYTAPRFVAISSACNNLCQGVLTY